MHRSFRVGFIFVLAFLFLPISYSCSDVHQDKRKEKRRRKDFEKEKERRMEESYAAYDKARKRHLGNQSPSGRKAMKHTQKKSKRYNNKKKEFFVSRWIRNMRYKRGRKPIKIE